MSESHDLKGSEARLWGLIEQRTHPEADTQQIDQRIWDLFGEQWAVVFTDLSGFSRQVAEFGIIHFLQVIFEMKRILLPIIAQRDGILIKAEADSFLIIFKRAEAAVLCAIDMQRACRHASERRRPEEQVLLCVGVGFGQILRIGDVDVYGREVNAASKLGEDTAKSHEILVTDAVRRAVEERIGLELVDLGISVPGSDQNYRVVYSV